MRQVRRTSIIGAITKAAEPPPLELTPLWDDIYKKTGDGVFAFAILDEVKALVEKRLKARARKKK
jgi:hypothetical protein